MAQPLGSRSGPLCDDNSSTSSRDVVHLVKQPGDSLASSPSKAKRADQENSSPGLVTAPAAKSPPRRRQSVRTSSYDDPDRSANRRREAALWVQQLTGQAVKSASDLAFRLALRDGAMLCQILHHLKPGIIPQFVLARIPEVRQRPAGAAPPDLECARAFVDAMRTLQVPGEVVPSIAHLQDEGPEERPSLVDCLLFLRGSEEARRRAHIPMEQMPALAKPPAAPTTPQHPAAAIDLLTPFQLRRRSMETPAERAEIEAAAPDAMGRRVPGSVAAGTCAAEPGSVPGVGSSAAASAAPQTPTAAVLATPPPDTPDAVDADLLRQCARITAAAPKRGVDGQASPVETALAIARMVKQCTAQLRATPPHLRGEVAPDSPLPAALVSSRSGGIDALSTAQLMAQLGPFLGSGITTVTQRYERMIADRDSQLKRITRVLEARERALAEARAALEEAQRAPPPPPPPASPAMRSGDREAQADEIARLREAEADALAELASAHDAADEAHDAAEECRARAAAAEAACQELQAQVGQLEAVAGKYVAVVAANAALHNEVQDLKGSIRVFCRVRPPGATGDASPPCTSVGVDGELAIEVKGQQRMFKYDRVFDGGASQAAVYEDTKPLVRSVLDGYNVCIFAYGQTGSGKTHTMSGSDVENLAGRGINYRALDDLFAINARRTGEVRYTVRVQLLEIYNEQLRDLLVDTPKRLDIRQTAASGLNVPDATQVPVSNTEEVLAVMARGAANRATAGTKMNERSSRSHSVLSVIVDGVSQLSGAATHGCLHLIDLAGSERVSRSEASGERLVEARHINRSLSALGSVMAALAAKSTHIPYRDSKLTALLQDSLAGNAKAMMFIHATSSGESVSTLAFGSRVSAITLGRATRSCESSAIFESRQAAQLAERQAADAAAEAEALRNALSAKEAAGAMMHAELADLRAELQVLRQQQAARPAAVSAVSTPASEGGSCVSGGRVPPLRVSIAQEERIAQAGTPLSARTQGALARMRGAAEVKPAAALPPRTPRAGGGATPRLPPATPRGLTPQGQPPSPHGGAPPPAAWTPRRGRDDRRSSGSSDDSCATVNGPPAGGAAGPMAAGGARAAAALMQTPAPRRASLGGRPAAAAKPSTGTLSRIPRLSLSGLSGQAALRGEAQSQRGPASARTGATPRRASADYGRSPSGALTERGRTSSGNTTTVAAAAAAQPGTSRRASQTSTSQAASSRDTGASRDDAAAGGRAGGRVRIAAAGWPSARPAASKRWN